MTGVEVIGPAPRGAGLRRVDYVGFDWDASLPQGPGFDVVSMGVRLGFEDGSRYLLRWYLREPYECLTTWEWPDGRLSPMARALDASERWSHLLGTRVCGQHVGMMETSWGSQPWSCRLDFEGGGSLVVCLGEMNDEGIPVYIPDALLVTGSRDHALAYQPLPTYPRAWAGE